MATVTSSTRKLNPTSNTYETNSGLTVGTNIVVGGTVDGRDIASDGSKLDGIESSATADQTAAEIRALVESASDSNVFTDADHTKLNGIATSANNYSLPAGSSSTRGGFKIGYTESGKNYPVEVSSEQMFVNVPWTDTNTNTTYTAGSGLTLSGTTFSHSDTSSQASSSNSGRTYIQSINVDGQGHVTGLSTATETVVNTDTNTQLSNEQVQDIVGAMVSSNTESGIAVTYDDTNGKLNLTVASQTDQNFTNADHTKLNGIATGADVTPSWVPSSDPSYATQSYVGTQITNLIDSSPSALNTLNELAAALGDDANFSTTITNSIASKQDTLTAGSNITISGGTISATNTNTQLSNEQVQDIVGAMLSGNTESGITVTYDDTNNEIDFTVASQTDQNFTNADHTKLNGIETGATADQTAAEIRALVESATDSNVFTNADHSKLNAIEASADVTDTTNVVAALTAGSNVTIAADGTISSSFTDTNTTYTAGSGLVLSGTTFSHSDTSSQSSSANSGRTYIQSINLDGQGHVTGLSTATETFVNTDTNTQLSNEQVQDIVGAMVSSNTESGIAVTYDDTAGKLNLTVASQTDQNFTNADHTKLNGIESGATADQTASEIRALVESATDSNVFTDADHSKLNAIEASADVTDTTNVVAALTAGSNVTIAANGTISSTNTNTQLSNEQVQDIVGAMVASNSESGITVTYQDTDGTLDFSVASQTDQNFTNADHTKLDGIETGATADQTASEILTLIKTVDGSGSGLDADLLDGISSGDFYRRTGTVDGAVSSAGWVTVATNTSGRKHGEVIVSDSDSGDHAYIRIDWMRSYADSNFSVIQVGGHGNRITGVRVLYQTSDNTYGTKLLQVYVTTGSTYGVRVHTLGSPRGYSTHSVVTPVIENTKSGYAVHGNSLEGLDQVTLAAEEGIKAGGLVYASGGDSSQWNTAYGWGNHASAGYVTSSGNTIIGTDADITTSNAEVVNNIYMTDGVITSHTKRTLTLANLGYTGATNANYITNNNQLTNGAGYITSDTQLSTEQVQDAVGAMLSGNTESGITVTYDDTNNEIDFTVASQTDQNFTTTLKNKLDGIAAGATNVTNNNQLTNGAGYVTTDTNTTYSAGTHLALSGTTFNVDFATTDKVVNIGHNATTNNEGEIILDTSNAGSPQIGFTEHGDASWAIGIDDADNSFKMHGSVGTTIPTINNLATPFFEITTSAAGYLNGSRIFADSYHPNADTLTTARTIAGTSFNGSANIDISYNNLTNKPTIPTNNNQLTNGAGYITSDTQLSTEQVQDAVGAMLSGNTESGITVTYDDTNNEIDFTVASQTDNNFTTTLKNKLDGIAAGATNVTNNNQLTNGAGYITSDTQLSTEQVQDAVGAMLTGNTESGITVTYDDTNNEIDFTVASQTDNNFTNADHSKLDGIAAGAEVNVQSNWNATSGDALILNKPTIPSGNQIIDWTVSAGSGTEIHSDNYTNTTYSAGSGLTLSGTTFSHADTSSQSSSANSGRTYIQSINLDGQGHVTGLSTATETVVNTDTNTTYSAGRGLDLSGTQFLLETDLRDSISYIGYDSNDYIQWSNNSYFRSVVSGTERFRVNTSGIDVNGTATASGFQTDTSNTNYNLISRNGTSFTLYVQAAQSNSTQPIASFRYGSATANGGTETFRIRKDNVNVFGANFTVGGSITGNSKNFSIPHPTKEGKRLVHSCLEGPEIGVYFRGRSTSATIEMPDYWAGLVHLDSMTVELTAIGPNQDLYVEDIADDGDVTVGSNTETALNYFYVVYGERKDLERLEVEIDDTVEVEESFDN